MPVIKGSPRWMLWLELVPLFLTGILVALVMT